ncbi:amino acid adenylation domain-containing protein, partial [Kitasatospora sp. NPDC049258]|uniref:amino acid adenylation domain-containing protein n=1 Tax=Kitasatospora sp. NPDC049258 TaxID=3155394 RepID=UPI00341ABF98
MPLDPAHPTTRLDDLITDSAPHLLLLDHPQAQRLAPHPHTLLLEDNNPDNTPDHTADHNPDLPTTPDRLAYVIYTSGSTGKPKGVQIEHRAVADLRATLEHGFGVRPPAAGGPALRVAHTAPFSFDASIEQLSWLLSGHELHLVPNDVRRDPEALIALIRSARLQVMDSTASQLELLVSLGLFGDAGYRPELVMVGGEAISPALWAAMRATTGTRFFNLYGPTECTVDATIRPVELGGDQPSIGRPLPNTRVYVVDRHGAPAPIGVPGELWIGGAGLARGYWNRPELTAERFLDDPFRPGERVYRTGDLGRWNADGELEFCGRIDDQVKIRGHRVELGEIAAVLSEHPGVREAVVVLRTDAGGPARLVAYAVPAGPGVDAASLRRFAAERLPEFMVPAAVLLLERLPLNANDKLDRNALPAPAADDLVDATTYVAPATASQLALAEIWCEVLGCARVGARDDFFALGGHSLLVTQVVSRLESRLGVRVPLRAVFEAPVLERLAALVDERAAGTDDVREIVRVPRDGALPLSFAQQRLWFLDRLVPDSAFYNMPDPYRVRGGLDVAALQSAVDTVVARHESLRTTFTEQDGTPCQLVHPAAEVTVRVAEAPDEERARELAETETLAPFDLERGPLLRVLVVRVAGTDSSLLLLTLHHIISDGWSTGVLLDELSRAYAAASTGSPVELPELPVQYADFAAWQRAWLRDEVLEGQRTYWSQALDGITPLELPLDRPRPAVQSHRGATLEFTVDPATAERLRT